MTATDSGGIESLRHEYTEAALSFRHYSALRFVIFSIYVGVIAALGGVAIGVVGAVPINSVGGRVAAVAALLLTCVFWICESACRDDRQHYKNVMLRLEGTLGYDSVRGLPDKTFIRPAIAFKVLFSVSGVVWVFVLIWSFLI